MTEEAKQNRKIKQVLRKHGFRQWNEQNPDLFSSEGWIAVISKGDVHFFYEETNPANQYTLEKLCEELYDLEY